MTRHPNYPPTLGAFPLPDGRCLFRVWAPKPDKIELRILGDRERTVPLTRDERGYCQAIVDDVLPGTRYFYRLDGERDRPDPASRFQPDGVHLPSAVVDQQFPWTDSHWRGLPLHEYITYELHVGTFTEKGTFAAVIGHLDDLVDLGITAIELLPVAQFPGERNWGYDGVHLFAPQNTYGGPAELKTLINACHERGLAVIMDVVYNHLGPEGNYLAEFGHYFTDRHRTPWGPALNFDGRHSDEVRRFFIENALFWIDEFHVDALRLDAIHAIFDSTARPVLRELADAVRLEGERLNRRVYTIAESNLNDPRLLEPAEVNGWGLDGQWCDDFHHSLRTALTDEEFGYYRDFCGVDDLAKSYRDGFALVARESHYRGRRNGVSSSRVAPKRFVVYSQNHDQVGNRAFGERLTSLASFEDLKLAAAAVILSPYQPMLFMGEEYGEKAPFHYFVSHLDPALNESVRAGRLKEFASFRWQSLPPAPHDEATFAECKLNHELQFTGHHRTLREYYKTLISLRKRTCSLLFANREQMEVSQPAEEVIVVSRWTQGEATALILNFSKTTTTAKVRLANGKWRKQIDSSDSHWLGPGGGPAELIESDGKVPLSLPPRSAVLLKSEW